MVRLISEARTIARSEQRPVLTVDILAEAVDRLRIGVSRTEPNPFRVMNPRPGGEPPPSVRDLVVPDAVPGRTRRRTAR